MQLCRKLKTYVRHDQTRCYPNHLRSCRTHSIRSGSNDLIDQSQPRNSSQPKPSLVIQCPTSRVSIQKYCRRLPALRRTVSEFASLVDFCMFKHCRFMLIPKFQKCHYDVTNYRSLFIIFPWLLVQSHLFHQLHRIGQVGICVAVPGRTGPPEVRLRRGVFAGPSRSPELLLENAEGIGALDATHGIVGHTSTGTCWDLMGSEIFYDILF